MTESRVESLLRRARCDGPVPSRVDCIVLLHAAEALLKGHNDERAGGFAFAAQRASLDLPREEFLLLSRKLEQR